MARHEPAPRTHTLLMVLALATPVAALALAGCSDSTAPIATYSLSGSVKVIGYVTDENSHFLGTRVEAHADGIPVVLMYGRTAVARTSTVRGDYRFTGVAPGGYTVRALAPAPVGDETTPLVVTGDDLYSRDTLALASAGDLYPAPNPVVDVTWIGYQIADTSIIEIDVCDAAGNRVRQIRSPTGRWAPGFYQVAWNGRTTNGDLAPAGLYWAVFTSGSDLRAQALFRDSLPAASATARADVSR